MRNKTGQLYAFGPFVLDLDQHALLRKDRPVSLTPKTYDLLVLLLRNRGRMLSKDELMEALWPDSFVDESNLTQQVSLLRKALRETPGQDRYIVTISGRGYRFDAEVIDLTNITEAPQDPAVDDGRVKLEVLTAAAAQPVPAGTPSAESGVAAAASEALPDRPIRRPSRRWLGLVFALAILVPAVYTVYRKVADRKTPRTLAILPFQSLRDDPQYEFLGFSLADAVITKLGPVRSLAVRPSSAVQRYRNGRALDIAKIASDLHVNTLLTGNYIRDGDDLRITAQLIDATSQNILWKGAFDVQYQKLLSVHDTVAQNIIRGLELSLSPLEAERLKPEGQVDPRAYDLYLRGVDLYARNEFRAAIDNLRKSADIDPSFALTWAELGRAYTANASFELGGREEYRQAQAAYEKALSLRPMLLEARIYMANLLTDTGRVERAVPLLRSVLEENPNHAEAHWELGYAYRFAGMLKESVQECERARLLDPGVKLNSSALNAYLYLGRYDQFLGSLPNNPDSALVLFYRGFAQYHKGQRIEAARYFDAAYDLRPSMLQARIGKALREDLRNRTREGVAVLNETENEFAQRGVGDPEALYKIAQAYAVLGESAPALRTLRLSVENGFFSYPYFSVDPLLDRIRNADDFASILAHARQRHEAFKKAFF